MKWIIEPMWTRRLELRSIRQLYRNAARFEHLRQFYWCVEDYLIFALCAKFDVSYYQPTHFIFCLSLRFCLISTNFGALLKQFLFFFSALIPNVTKPNWKRSKNCCNCSYILYIILYLKYMLFVFGKNFFLDNLFTMGFYFSRWRGLQLIRYHQNRSILEL